MTKDVLPVHHADRRHDVAMPYAPALLVRRGSLLFLSGVTAAPVYHSHPHREEEFTLGAAGCGIGDLVSATPYLTDVGEHDELNRVWPSYLGEHRPTTTTVEVSRLVTHPRCKIEISAIAVADTAPRARATRPPARGTARTPARRSARRRS